MNSSEETPKVELVILLVVANSHPACQLFVLCGHMHGGDEVQVLANLRVVTGPAEYGKPEVQRIIEVE